MVKKSGKNKISTQLRQKAETILKSKRALKTEQNKEKLIHELMIHQIELEMQNEELEKARQETMSALEKYSNLYQSAPIAYLTLDCHSQVLEANLTASKLLNTSIENLMKLRLGVFIADESKPVFNNFLSKALKSNQLENCELTFNINNQAYWISLNAKADITHKTVLVLAINISDKKIASEKIYHQANYDVLTELPNRRLLHDRLEQELKKSARNKQFALLFLDVDLFKDVNDSLGHDMGDKLLKLIAERLLTCVRDMDTVSRSGGDEFTIILGEISDFYDTERVANSILNIMKVPFQLEEDFLFITLSIGIAIFPEDTTNATDLMKKADQALYSAKNMGRNCFCYFTPDMQTNAQRKALMTAELHEALEKNQFYLEYQPIYNLATQQVLIAEILLRWEHPEKGVIHPLEFIPLAEETGLIVLIGNWVLKQTIQQVKKWRKNLGKELKLSINKSPMEFKTLEKHHLTWLEFIAQMNLDPKSIILEITESTLMDSQQDILEKLQCFKDQGVEIALDNFGTGYSSLSYLSKANIEYIKIDKSFINNLQSNSASLVLCEAIILMAHRLGIKVIAEGIETKEQYQLLLAAGCDLGQGFLFSKSLLTKDFEALIQTK